MTKYRARKDNDFMHIYDVQRHLFWGIWFPVGWEVADSPQHAIHLYKKRLSKKGHWHYE